MFNKELLESWQKGNKRHWTENVKELGGCFLLLVLLYLLAVLMFAIK